MRKGHFVRSLKNLLNQRSFLVMVVVVVASITASLQVAASDTKNITVLSDRGELVVSTDDKTVQEVLQHHDITLTQEDMVTPELSTPLTDDMVIVIEHATPIEVVDGNFVFQTRVKANTIQEALDSLDIDVRKSDTLIPEASEKITHGTRIIITRSQSIVLRDGGKNKELYSQKNTVGEVLDEAKIALGDQDKLSPARSTLIVPGMQITITRVGEKEIEEEKDIPFETRYKNDPTMLKGKTSVEQEGKKGKKKQRYHIALENGKEVDRTLLDEEVVEKPVDQIILRGTKEPIGKVMSGKASWFHNGSGLTTAARDFPRGTRLRVTNTSNGKAVIVTVNGWGPQPSTGRILDLNVDAFAAIEDIGRGVVSVRVEELL